MGEFQNIEKFFLFSEKSMIILKKEYIAMFPTSASIKTRRKRFDSIMKNHRETGSGSIYIGSYPISGLTN